MQTEKKRQRKTQRDKKQPSLKSKNGTPAEKKTFRRRTAIDSGKEKYRHMIGTEKKQEPR